MPGYNSRPVVSRGRRKIAAIPPWVIIDTFTGADGTNLNGTTCDSGQTRVLVSGSYAIIDGGKAYLSNTILAYQMGRVPVHAEWDYTDGGDGGLFEDFLFYFDGSSWDRYGIRFNGGAVQIVDYTIGYLTWTTGINTGGFHSGNAKLDISPSGITLTVNDTGLGLRVLTYVAAMKFSTNTYVGLACNGSHMDNLYVR